MRETIEVINELKERGLIKDYAIGGAIGVLRWVEPFFTRDLDVFIVLVQETKDTPLISLSPIYDYLKKRYNEWVGQWLMIEGVPVEFIPAEGLSRESVENATDTDFGGVNVKVMRPEYLIPLLLSAGRDKDKIKIRMLLEQAKVDMEGLKAVLVKYDLYEKFLPFITKS